MINIPNYVISYIYIKTYVIYSACNTSIEKIAFPSVRTSLILKAKQSNSFLFEYIYIIYKSTYIYIHIYTDLSIQKNFTVISLKKKFPFLLAAYVPCVQMPRLSSGSGDGRYNYSSKGFQLKRRAAAWLDCSRGLYTEFHVNWQINKSCSQLLSRYFNLGGYASSIFLLKDSVQTLPLFFFFFLK